MRPIASAWRLAFAAVVFASVMTTGLGDTSPGLPELTTAEQVHALLPAEAIRRYPVHLRGVVVYHDQYDSAVFLHDGASGIYVEIPQSLAAQPGDELDVRGFSDPGKFAPLVKAGEVQVVGRREMPAPIPAAYELLATGNEDSQWVEIAGILRSITPAPDHGNYLDIAMLGGRLRCLIEQQPAGDLQALVNAAIHVRGVCFSRFNTARQLRAPWLGVSSMEDIHVDRLPANEPVSSSIAELLRFRSAAVNGERVKVRGVVSLLQKEQSLFIQEGDIGLHVKTLQSTPVAPGDVVEVLGFAVLGQFNPILEDATYRRIGAAPPPAPVVVEASQLPSQPHNACLIRVNALLLDRAVRGDEQLLVLQSGDVVFTAALPMAAEHGALSSLRNGSLLALTGVCVAQEQQNWNPSERYRPEEFRLLLRSASDIAVLRAAPWWTLSRLLWALAVAGVFILSSSAWAITLRQRVRRQTRIIQDKLRREAIAEERGRIAREFHDSLEQELAAITMQLDVAAAQFEHSPRDARLFLDQARTISRRSLEEARRSIWDLRSQFLENSDLPTALQQFIDSLGTGSPATITLETQGTPIRLPSRMECHFLRIVQEAVANSLKHAGARSISVLLCFASDRLRVFIRDDGGGFDVHSAPSLQDGHFGLLDMRERIEKLGGALTVRSEFQKGTEVIAEALLPQGAPLVSA